MPVILNKVEGWGLFSGALLYFRIDAQGILCMLYRIYWGTKPRIVDTEFVILSTATSPAALYWIILVTTPNNENRR